MAQLIKLDGTITRVKGEGKGHKITYGQINAILGKWHDKVKWPGSQVVMVRTAFDYVHERKENKKASELIGKSLLGPVLIMDKMEALHAQTA